jgi:lipid-A-disaccharide synthase
MTAGSIFILAGEPSGDQIAAHLMRAINDGFDRPDWIGVGGPLMRAEGLTPAVDMEALTVFGFGGALLAYPRLSKLANRLVDMVMDARPLIILTVDVKGFSLRFAQRLRRRMQAEGWSAPIIHCVAPTVWAWGRWRARKFAAAMDGLLCLFPFEPDYFHPHGLDAIFIGHPEAFDPMLDTQVKTDADESRKTVLLLPGSRRTEIDLILPPMMEAVDLLKARYERLSFVLPAVPRHMRRIMDMVDGRDIQILENSDGLSPILKRADAMMAASGTVTLQTALYGIPGVTCYRTGAFSAALGQRLVDFEKVVLPNVVLGRPLYPFLFQNALTGLALAESVLSVLQNPAAQREGRLAATELRRKLSGDKDCFADLIVPAVKKWLETS